MTALAKTEVSASDALPLPASWSALPGHLRKPFWTTRETQEATGLSRSTLARLWSDPRSGFPRRRKVGGRIHVPAVAAVRFMEGSNA